MLLSGSNGGFRWVAGTSVMDSGRLEGSVEAVGEVCWLGDFPVRREGNCLWWKVRPVVGEKAEGWVA